jgi:putative glutamine amidotransferase
VPRRPLIAITATTEIIRGISRVRVNEAYTRSVERAGMLPLVIPPLHDERRAAAIVASVDGLLLTGGEDVDPARYGAPPHPATDSPHDARDRSEIALCVAARTIALPTLAICRGLQILNVALGGTLVQDIPSERPGSLDHSPDGPRDHRAHPISVSKGSRLADALGATELTVNTSHHQALDTIASDLLVTATAPDGIVEGAEWSSDRWWMLGVQWHPEELFDTPESWDRALFEAFCRAVVAHTADQHALDSSAPVSSAIGSGTRR